MAAGISVAIHTGEPRYRTVRRLATTTVLEIENASSLAVTCDATHTYVGQGHLFFFFSIRTWRIKWFRGHRSIISVDNANRHRRHVKKKILFTAVVAKSFYSVVVWTKLCIHERLHSCFAPYKFISPSLDDYMKINRLFICY